jgi:hypothetical protein
MSTKPRCGRCRKRAPLQRTAAGPLCKSCVSRLPTHLQRDPTQPRPNAARTLRPSKQGGMWTTRAKGPTTAKGARRVLKGR